MTDSEAHKDAVRMALGDSMRRAGDRADAAAWARDRLRPFGVLDLADVRAQHDVDNFIQTTITLPAHELADILEDLQRRVDRSGAKQAKEISDLRQSIAYRIRAELVCCHVYDDLEEARETWSDDAFEEERSARGHDICYWGEAAARIAEGRDDEDDS